MINLLKKAIRNVLEKQEIDHYENALIGGYTCVDSIENHKYFFDMAFDRKGVTHGVDTIWQFEDSKGREVVAVIVDGERNTIRVVEK